MTLIDLVQRDAKILLLRRRGKTLQEIADELGLTRLDVYRILDRSKYPND
jgi:predicted transcriptional regulator